MGFLWCVVSTIRKPDTVFGESTRTCGTALCVRELEKAQTRPEVLRFESQTGRRRMAGPSSGRCRQHFFLPSFTELPDSEAHVDVDT